MKRKIRMGMIGGGPGSFIGEVHRLAARLDGLVELVSGVFTRDRETTLKLGRELGISEDRLYSSYLEMIKEESELPKTERIDFITIVTPNFLHFDPAKQALENGFHIFLEKPISMTLTEALKLKELAAKSNLKLALAHGYTGYPMVKQAKAMIAGGEFGKIRKIYVEYPQGWLSNPIENEGNVQAAWRVDPNRSGIAGSMGDIGTHAANLAEYVSGLKITKVCADLNIVVEDRPLDDDGAVLLKFDNGASGVLMVSQIAAGEENGVKIRVYGEKGGIEWKQEENNSLLVKWLDKPMQVIRTGGPDNLPMALHNQRIPAGHPEGFIEAFANIYRNFSRSIDAINEGKTPKPEWLDFPDAEDGVREMLFVEKVIESGKSSEKWIHL